jgi:hypothetical protein
LGSPLFLAVPFHRGKNQLTSFNAFCYLATRYKDNFIDLKAFFYYSVPCLETFSMQVAA